MDAESASPLCASPPATHFAAAPLSDPLAPEWVPQETERGLARSSLAFGRSQSLDSRQVLRPFFLPVTAELIEVLPGVKAGIVAVIEDELHGILADRLDRAN